MTASRPSRAGAPALARAVCALTVAVTLAFLVLAIVDPNAGGPAHVSASGPSPQDETEGGYVPYAAFSALDRELSLVVRETLQPARMSLWLRERAS